MTFYEIISLFIAITTGKIMAHYIILWIGRSFTQTQEVWIASIIVAILVTILMIISYCDKNGIL